MSARLTLGRIVWASVPDANGFRKLRPAIIVTPSERLTETGPVEVVAVTSRLPKPLPDDHVLLPWHAQGHPRTGLNRPCAAVCTWVARITPDDIDDIAGIVPGAVMATILEKIAVALPPPATASETPDSATSDNAPAPPSPTDSEASEG
jgi:mRNA-degrading endonuclease toxin of MazEF toxin-antitoxin module